MRQIEKSKNSASPWENGNNTKMSSVSVAKHRKKTTSLVSWSFFNEAHLRCMKNEAGLRPMKRGFGTRKTSRALRFTATKLPLHTSVASASYSRSECFIVIREQIRTATLEMFTKLWYNKIKKGGGFDAKQDYLPCLRKN